MPTAALVVGCASSSVALAAIVASFFNTRLGLRHQRLLAREERIWARRADVYQELLQLLSRKELLGDKATFGQPIFELWGSVSVFASEKMWVEYGKLCETLNGLAREDYG